MRCKYGNKNDLFLLWPNIPDLEDERSKTVTHLSLQYTSRYVCHDYSGGCRKDIVDELLGKINALLHSDIRLRLFLDGLSIRHS